MGSRVIISTTEDSLRSLLENQKLPIKVTMKLIKAQSTDDFIEVLPELYQLNEDKRKDIWDYTINTIWDNHDICQNFDKEENIFFRELLKQGGIINKVELLKIPVLKTNYKISATADNLLKFGLVDSYRLSNNGIVYILNLSFYHKVFHNE